MAQSLTFNPEKTALVLIDLQKGVLGLSGKPYDSATVLSNAVRLAEAFRNQNARVVLVHVGTAANGKDMINVPTDASLGNGGERPDDWMELAHELNPGENDLIITKRQWGAFYGTDLELQLRRRNIDTIVLGGIATNFGVESTARDAYERNYTQIFAEDAMTDMSEEAHNFAVDYIFKRMGYVRSTDEIINALGN
jgi:nicotinamidase-related amidase